MTCSEFRTMRPTDLISTLVSIYDSHELFIKEVQSLFANMLLQSREGAFDDEVGKCWIFCSECVTKDSETST